jgi:hypothetical protein
MNVFKGEMNGHSIMIIFSLEASIKLIRVFNIMAARNNVTSSPSATCSNDSNDMCQYSE